MPLDQARRDRITAEAEKRGIDPALAIRAAEKIAASRDRAGPASAGEGEAPAPSGSKPTFECFLLGALPYLTVREFRAEWLGLAARIPDDDLITGDFLAKHGGAPTSAPTPEEPAP